MRVVFAALGISALTFVAGVAGDLSLAAPSTVSRPALAESVIVPIPPNAVRAHPLDPVAAVSNHRSHHSVRARGRRKHRAHSGNL